MHICGVFPTKMVSLPVITPVYAACPTKCKEFDTPQKREPKYLLLIEEDGSNIAQKKLHAPTGSSISTPKCQTPIAPAAKRWERASFAVIATILTT